MTRLLSAPALAAILVALSGGSAFATPRLDWTLQKLSTTDAAKCATYAKESMGEVGLFRVRAIRASAEGERIDTRVKVVCVRSEAGMMAVIMAASDGDEGKDWMNRTKEALSKKGRGRSLPHIAPRPQPPKVPIDPD